MRLTIRWKGRDLLEVTTEQPSAETPEQYYRSNTTLDTEVAETDEVTTTRLTFGF